MAGESSGSTSDAGSGAGGGPVEVAGPPRARTELADRIRELVEMSMWTDLAPGELGAVARDVAALTERLRDRMLPSSRMLETVDGVPTGSVNDPVEGSGNPVAPPLTGIRMGDGEMWASVRLGDAYQGAPGRAHGGWVSAVLDHAVGRAAAAAGTPGMTVVLNVEYHRATPLGVPLEVHAGVAGSQGRKVYVTGRIQYDEQVTATVSATLVAVSGLPARAEHTGDGGRA
ncbi:Acyl-coenzyme A thioesterase PaaI, contains HGG motif [Haloechinothrix alba]|uniref:Acyl-coenzyme A thioesterase THEM4 n=1 Tax=Haloechinothrix alba TaxID=664784 RepID=A0A239A350_9PSEU|nr:PaaI family thioesterase [Haloechinothrix alba]SNR89444.1 Acyl-coenzyme A thioesterase PaaI, contains HGG motif [Haloechinothrix alba]